LSQLFIATAPSPNPLQPHASPQATAGFLNLSQCRVRPLTYNEPRRFDTMPSQPIWQAWGKDAQWGGARLFGWGWPAKG